MGWWQIGTDGENSGGRPAGMVWGDEIADIMDALDEIRAVYRREWERPITHAELQAGFNFSTGAIDD